MKDKFIQFLKDNDAYESFIKNMRSCYLQSNSFDEYINYILKIKQSEKFVSEFIWIDVPEGNYFWEDLDEKWRSICQ